MGVNVTPYSEPHTTTVPKGNLSLLYEVFGFSSQAKGWSVPASALTSYGEASRLFVQ